LPPSRVQVLLREDELNRTPHRHAAASQANSSQVRRPQLIEEVTPMSDVTTAPSNQDAGSQVRPLSVRMTDSVRAQLDIIAQLNDRSVTDEVRFALEHWIEKSKADPLVLARAAQVRAEIERESATKQEAIAAIFDSPITQDKTAPAPPRSSARSKSSEA
jgi:hypothetical protein